MRDMRVCVISKRQCHTCLTEKNEAHVPGLMTSSKPFGIFIGVSRATVEWLNLFRSAG